MLNGIFLLEETVMQHFIINFITSALKVLEFSAKKMGVCFVFLNGCKILESQDWV